MNSSAKSPKPRFRVEDLWRTLRIIEKHGTLGRKRIVRELEVGEGTTRTILVRLKEKGSVKSTPRGHSLTEKGRRELAEKLEEFVSLNAGDLTVGKEDVAILVKKKASKVRRGIEQRDAAIKAGADGATVLLFEDKRLRLPETTEKVDEDVGAKILGNLSPSEGDVIIIGSGRSKIKAELGALAAARSLTD